MYSFLDKFIELFCGRKDTLVIGEDNGWIGRTEVPYLGEDSFKSFLSYIIKNKKKFAIYSQFQQHKRWRCKFVALDFDYHGKDNQQKIKKIGDKIDDVLSHANKFFFCDKSYIIKEKTENGWHLYIPLLPTTKKGGTIPTYPQQNTVLYYIDMIKDKINMMFSDVVDHDVEFFPKGKLKGDADKTYGSAIRFHFNGQWIYKINKIKRLDIEPIVKRAKEINYPSRVIGEHNVSDLKYKLPTKKSGDKREIGELPELLKRYCNLIDAKKCIINAIKGQYNLHGANGNKMRVRIVQELHNLGVPKNDIISAFENQSDFKYKESKYHVEQCIKHSYPYPSCKSVQDTGYCDPTCWKLMTSTKSQLSGKEEREPIPNPLDGWNDLFNKIGELIESEESYFIRKTTRSGTTTATILEDVKQKKKMLMIAPTKKIYDETLMKAINKYGLKKGITPPFPKSFKISNNAEICPRIKGEEEILEVFPFLLKPSCKECEVNCPYKKFKENMEKYNIVFLSTQKLRVLIDNAQTSTEAWNFLNKLISWCDFVFIDECYNIFEVNFFDIPVVKEKFNSFHNTHYSYSCKQEYLLTIDEFDQWNGEPTKFTNKLKEFVNKVYNLYEQEDRANVIYQITDQSIRKYLEEDKNWVKTFQSFINFYNDKKKKDIRFLVDFFIGLSYSSVYLQKRRKWNGNDIASLICINSIKHFMSFLSHLNKPLIMTDAVYPPVKLNKIFDLKEININDPMRTAEKQTVVVVEKADPFYKGYVQNSELIKFLRKHGEGENFLVSQSKRYDKYTERIISEAGIEIEIGEQTYHRSDKTIGVESDLRKMIVICGSFIPRHVYDIPATKYIELGYLDEEDPKIAGHYLENHNARSAFFQTISRVKDPEGEEESIVFVYGMKKRIIKEWFLELGISTPKIVSYEEWKK